MLTLAVPNYSHSEFANLFTDMTLVQYPFDAIPGVRIYLYFYNGT